MTISHDEANQQFYSSAEGLICRLQYELDKSNRIINIQSIIVPAELRGRRLGYFLLENALNYAQDHHYKVFSDLEVVNDFIDNHPEYHHLIT